METISVVSNNYRVSGEILNTNMVKTLTFMWNNRSITLGMSISDSGDKLIEKAKCLIDTYIDKLANPSEEKEVRLYYWFLSEAEYNGEKYIQAHGNVTGHSRIADSVFINTSEVMAYYIDTNSEDLIIETKNTTYKCPLLYCNFKEQSKDSDIIPNFDKIKAEYEYKLEKHSIEPGNVLLVISNFDNYYFHSLYCVKQEGEDCINCHGSAHIGTFQDSFLVLSEDYSIDLRYFPHFQYIEFYSEDTDGIPFFIENIGSTIIYAETSEGTIKLSPGERKKVCKDNAEGDEIHLAGGDLYPAGIKE